MILRELPHLQPLPGRPADPAFRAWFYERWGRENAVILGRARQAEYPPFTQTLSIKRAWGGDEDYLVDSRRLAVNDDRLLILNEGARYGACIDSSAPVTSLGVFFRPGMAQELAAAARASAAQALAAEDARVQVPLGFAEHLRPLDAPLARQLDALRTAVLDGETCEQWLEERLQDLLWAMLAAEPGWRARSLRLADQSRSAHAELLERIDRATDHLLSASAEPLTLDQLAAVARLSKYHLVRLFRQVHGLTPMAFLARTRLHHAERLMADASLGLDDVAAMSGFGSRQTLFRQLRRHRGASGRALRQAVPRAT